MLRDSKDKSTKASLQEEMFNNPTTFLNRILLSKTCATAYIYSVMIFNQALARVEIGLHHFLDERIKIDVALPAK